MACPRPRSFSVASWSSPAARISMWSVRSGRVWLFVIRKRTRTPIPDVLDFVAGWRRRRRVWVSSGVPWHQVASAIGFLRQLNLPLVPPVQIEALSHSTRRWHWLEQLEFRWRWVWWVWACPEIGPGIESWGCCSAASTKFVCRRLALQWKPAKDVEIMH